MKLLGLMALGWLFGGWFNGRKQYAENYRAGCYIAYGIVAVALAFQGVI